MVLIGCTAVAEHPICPPEQFHPREGFLRRKGLVESMNEALDPLNLLILAIAVVIFLRLRSVLGRRTGQERKPFDSFGWPKIGAS